ncbi:MAG TPA: bacillithiol biosynthesis cysteine-adding enzyme BshC [Longimicrobiales bacterium]|nr:bacillithiol biosynthesis cysteine-adding enzyme BshC [Longimicrobiales bacterium]
MAELNLEILVRPLGGGSLIRDYLAGDPALAPFFAGSPFDPDAYRRKTEEIRTRFDADRLDAMAGSVHALGEEARDKLTRIAAGDGFFVTTGQQPGLFGGPLYTVHKALSAIALARRLEALLDLPVLALFWIASDDHDWPEANHIHVLDPGNALHRLELDGAVEPARSMGLRSLGRGAETTLDKLTEILPPSEFTGRVLERLRAAYSDGTVASAFRETLEAVFDGMALGLVDAQDPVVRRLGEGVIRRELERGEEHEAALAAQTERVEAAGYPAQVPILPGASNVFYEDERGRERLVRDDGAWLLRRSRRRLSAEELGSMLKGAPERFSGNVVLRPVVESAVFPTLAYVGGPGEVSYLAQTGCLFAAHGVGMPLVYPRLSVTLVERKVRKVLEKFGLEVEAFGKPVQELVAEVVREEVPAEVEGAVERLRESVEAGYEALFEAAREIDPTLKGPIFQARSEAFKGLAEVEKKIRQHIKTRGEMGLEQLEKAAANLAPLGKPQERVLNIHQYEARYGGGLAEAILERMDIRLDGTGSGWTGPECG